jgi:hypothetical protein
MMDTSQEDEKDAHFSSVRIRSQTLIGALCSIVKVITCSGFIMGLEGSWKFFSGSGVLLYFSLVCVVRVQSSVTEWPACDVGLLTHGIHTFSTHQHLFHLTEEANGFYHSSSVFSSLFNTPPRSLSASFFNTPLALSLSL